MRRTKQFALTSLLCICLVSCVKELDPKYQRPDWLAGKVYTQIKDTAIFETFARALELTGFDTIINTSGSFTVFVPNNDAFDLYFQENPAYNSIEDIPIDELTNLVKYHIVQNPWSKLQLQQLDVWGWIDTLDENNDEPKGFKRETLLEMPNRKYGVTNRGREDHSILDTLDTDWYRRVITDSRKYAPIFFKDYFDIYDLSLEDFKFYFDRDFEDPKDLYFVNARILGNEIFAENGFVYNIDRVVKPLDNAYEILSRDYTDRSYSKFLDMINYYPDFNYNETETFDQAGADLGYDVDSLFDLTFPDLTFNITRERTKAPPGVYGLPGNVTIRYHHGMVAPTNEALVAFENEYLPGGNFWDGIDGAPKNIWKVIVNSHLSINPIYETDLNTGFYNGEFDLINIEPSTIIQKEYGSNATFLGVDEVIVPFAFSSVAEPVYTRKGFRNVMLAVEESGLLPVLKRMPEGAQRLMFFVEADENTKIDSSLLVQYNQRSESYDFYAYQISGTSAQRYNFLVGDLRLLLLNHIAVREATGIPRKEFIPNLAGNYLIVNNETGEVSGTVETTVGYMGEVSSQNFPKEISQNSINGVTYEIDDWFSFSVSNMFITMQNNFPEFHSQVVKAGLANSTLNTYNFLSESEKYTVFAPTAAALAEAQVDTMTKDELASFVRLHFIRGEMIFTDQSSSSGYYETTRKDEASTQFSTKYTKIYVDTDNVDEISIPAKGGGTYVSLVESGTANILSGISKSDGQATYPETVNNGVIHGIDKALKVKEIQTSL